MAYFDLPLPELRRHVSAASEPADLATLLDAGLTREEAWDVIEIAAMYNFTNRLAMGTNMLPNEEYSAQARPRID